MTIGKRKRQKLTVMRSYKLWLIIGGAVLIYIMIYSLFFKETTAPKINIGTTSDTGGMIIHYILNEKKFQAREKTDDFAMYSIKDCCSSTSEWAMSTDTVDIAVMCQDAAQALITRDSHFEIIGPCLVNSDVILVRPRVSPTKIGVAQKRDYQETLVYEKFGQTCTTVSMLPTAVPYAYEKNAVDGVVIDILTGLGLEGQRISSSAPNRDLVTYVLVVKRSFKSNPLYNEFMQVYREAANELNDPAILKKEVESYKQLKLSSKEVELWQQMKVRYVSPLDIPL